jgi:hypothetical protein
MTAPTMATNWLLLISRAFAVPLQLIEAVLRPDYSCSSCPFSAILSATKRSRACTHKSSSRPLSGKPDIEPTSPNDRVCPYSEIVAEKCCSAKAWLYSVVTSSIRFTSTRSSWRRRSVFTNDPRAPDCPGELPVQARTPQSRQFQSSVSHPVSSNS